MQVIPVLVFPFLLCSLVTALSTTKALKYLFQYGYATPTSGNFSHIMDETSYRKAIRDFQAFAGLQVTGKLDSETQEMMMAPRCGVKDNVGTGVNRAKRYTEEGSIWDVKDLTYKISKYPRRLKRSEVDEEIQKAFDIWSGHTDLTFTPKSGDVHIEILFHQARHGDHDTFDGPGGTLAHAYFPRYGGAVHFDESESWTINFMNSMRSNSKTHLFQVAAHEFGHSLGLSHSEVDQALMAPFYRNSLVVDLETDDIEGIQALYGKKTLKTNSRAGKKLNEQFPSPNRSLCDDPKFDTIFNSAEGNTYLFKGDNYWDSVPVEDPKRISDNWIGLPGNIDASFTYKTGKTYFFKGSKFWRYKGTKVDGLYPKEISSRFPGVPNDLDAAMVWDGKIHFFKGSKYWRFNPHRITNPYPISDWSGVPNNLNAAIQWTNGFTYFFKDYAFYRFNDSAFAVEKTTPPFPKSSAYWWFGCKDAPSGTIETTESDETDY